MAQQKLQKKRTIGEVDENKINEHTDEEDYESEKKAFSKRNLKSAKKRNGNAWIEKMKKKEWFKLKDFEIDIPATLPRSKFEYYYRQIFMKYMELDLENKNVTIRDLCIHIIHKYSQLEENRFNGYQYMLKKITNMNRNYKAAEKSIKITYIEEDENYNGEEETSKNREMHQKIRTHQPMNKTFHSENESSDDYTTTTKHDSNYVQKYISEIAESQPKKKFKIQTSGQKITTSQKPARKTRIILSSSDESSDDYTAFPKRLPEISIENNRLFRN